MNTFCQSVNSRPVYLGCPVWSCADWKGSVYPKSASQKKSWLKYYAETFNTVEGNTTFYAIPSPETVHRWAEQAAPGFRFALKYPRVITHEKGLRHSAIETDRFRETLSILHERDRLGPTFMQFHDSFSPAQLPDLTAYLQDLPREFPFAVEVRDHAWFTGEPEAKLNQVLGELNMDRVIFDSRPLFSAPASDEFEVKSQSRKPQSPIRPYASGPHPFLRLVGRNEVKAVLPWIREWAAVVAEWIRQGKQPFIFTHTPNDKHAPELAALFHAELAKLVHGLPAELNFPHRSDQQLNLF